jgi:hypothetical protein
MDKITLEEALDLPFEQYMAWCYNYIHKRSLENPHIKIILSYPFSLDNLSTVWAQRYWFNKNGAYESYW